MNKVINGKRYDTETAKLIGEHANTYNYSDFTYECEELYRKKTGEFFIYGSGGPMSNYAVQTGSNSWSGSDKITPITEDEAKKWVEKYLDGDVYESLFGVCEDDNVAFSLLLPETLYNKLKQESEKTKKSMKDIIVDSLEHSLI